MFQGIFGSSDGVSRCSEVFRVFGTQKLVRVCHPNNRTSIFALGLSNPRATAQTAPLRGASATAMDEDDGLAVLVPALLVVHRVARAHLGKHGERVPDH